MSELKRKLIWPLGLLVLAMSGTIAIVGGRVKSARGHRDERAAPAATNYISPPASEVAQAALRAKSRTLSLQPEALKLSRRLGRRFSDPQRRISISSAILTFGITSQVVQIVRSQTERGETTRLAIGTGPASLTWNESDGSKSAGRGPSDNERRLIERLTFDSPDQLVLAQLRGAGYHTVARNVRPALADENYRGALWDIVRVDDPDNDEQRRPQSRWRLYYINSQTGLVDRVVSQIHGETFAAVFSDWRTRAGEKFLRILSGHVRGRH